MQAALEELFVRRSFEPHSIAGKISGQVVHSMHYVSQSEQILDIQVEMRSWPSACGSMAMVTQPQTLCGILQGCRCLIPAPHPSTLTIVSYRKPATFSATCCKRRRASVKACARWAQSIAGTPNQPWNIYSHQSSLRHIYTLPDLLLSLRAAIRWKTPDQSRREGEAYLACQAMESSDYCKRTPFLYSIINFCSAFTAEKLLPSLISRRCGMSYCCIARTEIDHTLTLSRACECSWLVCSIVAWNGEDSHIAFESQAHWGICGRRSFVCACIFENVYQTLR